MRKKRRFQPPQNQSSQNNRISLHVQSEEFSGPLPRPDILKQYSDVFPDCPRRIVEMAEKQANHRRELEKKALFSGANRELFGQVSALIITLAAIASGTYLTTQGRSVEGVAEILGALGSLVWIFIRGKRTQNKELAEKNPRVIER